MNPSPLYSGRGSNSSSFGTLPSVTQSVLGPRTAGIRARAVQIRQHIPWRTDRGTSFLWLVTRRTEQFLVSQRECGLEIWHASSFDVAAQKADRLEWWHPPQLVRVYRRGGLTSRIANAVDRRALFGEGGCHVESKRA